MKVKFNGEEVELEGNPPQVGDQLPKFKLFDQNGEKVKLAQLLGKPLLLSVVPDLQTPVCSTQTHKFNQQADHYPDATFVTISNNLYLPNMGVLTRTILVADATGKITYEEVVPDVANEPNYGAALKALEKLTSRVDE